jgi:hypothetical protein
LLRDLLSGKKNLLTSAGQNIAAVGQGFASHLRRRLDSQYASQQSEKTQDEQQSRVAFSASIAELFQQKDVRKAHQQDLQKIYKIKYQELFWECYWQYMTDLFLSQDTTQVLDILAFWFEDGYNMLEHQMYLIPSFFLGFADALDGVKKERKFGERARKLHECGLKNQQEYAWYVLVAEYFVEPERKGRLPFSKNRA